VPVRQLDPATFVRAYNVDLQPLYPWDGVADPPFGAAWAVLAPGESTKAHAHQECETFFVARGHGVLAIGDEQTEVGPGSVSFHPPYDNHVLTNASDQEELLFLTVYWEDAARREAADERPVREVSRTLVTAAPPTPNGDLHLGHLAGPYLSADYHARYLRLCGVDGRFVVGSDDNSPWVVGKGAELGEGPEETARRFTDAIVESLERSGVELAAFPRPNESPAHRELVREVFAALHERGHLVAKEVDTPYCEACDRALVEFRVRGACSHCGAGLTGNTCEECGGVVYGDVVDPHCTACGAPAVLRPVRRLVFPLAPHAEALRDWYRRVEMPTHLRSFCEEALTRGLPEVPATQPGNWGIEVPVPGFDDQRIYVWFEIAPRYLAYARHLSGPEGGGWQRWWKAEDSRVVQFCGFDNSFYYGVYIPAVLHAFDPEIRLPDAVVTNEFYRLDGEKFSTSRGHRILARDLAARVPVDAMRFYLAYTAPEREATGFTLAAFEATCRRELLEGWDGWLRELGRRVAELHGGELPATGDWTGEHRRFLKRLEALLAEAGEAYAAAGFSPQRATRVMGEIVREARRFGHGELHWDRSADTRSQERRTALALQALAAKVLALVAAPVMPETAARLWRSLGLGSAGPGPGAWDHALRWVPAGSDVSGLAEPLFPGLAAALDELAAGGIEPAMEGAAVAVTDSP
jgi:methionyl-tRNA synthetase